MKKYNNVSEFETLPLTDFNDETEETGEPIPDMLTNTDVTAKNWVDNGSKL